MRFEAKHNLPPFFSRGKSYKVIRGGILGPVVIDDIGSTHSLSGAFLENNFDKFDDEN